MIERCIHTVPYAFEMIPTIEGKINGGLPAVLAAEFERNRRQTGRLLRIISTDKQSLQLPDANAEIIAADSSDKIPPYSEWFGNKWSILHMEAHTAPRVREEVLTGMYRGDYSAPSGTIERSVEHTLKHPANVNETHAFTQRFRQPLNAMVKELQHSATDYQIINWQDPHFFFAEIAAVYGPKIQQLKKANIVQTGHLHTSLPPAEVMHISPWWKETLKGLASLQHIYVHTEENRRKLTDQLGSLLEPSHMPMPAVDVYDLGPDFPLLKRYVEECTDSTWQEWIGYEQLRPDQRAFIDELVRTKGRNMHRFLNGDRADPGKGLLCYVEAIDALLADLTQEERRTYRFFFTSDLLGLQEHDLYDVKQQYVRMLQEKLKELKEKYPGVIWTCDGIPKTAMLFAMDQDTTPVVPAIDDGLNLVGQEMTWINAQRKRPRVSVLSKGAGFSQETIRRGGEQTAIFVEGGNVHDLTIGLKESIRLSTSNPAKAIEMTNALSASYIEPRRDSVIVES